LESVVVVVVDDDDDDDDEVVLFIEEPKVLSGRVSRSDMLGGSCCSDMVQALPCGVIKRGGPLGNPRTKCLIETLVRNGGHLIAMFDDRREILH